MHLDGTEIKCWTSSNAFFANAEYSEYKAYKTPKFLLGIDPMG